MGLEIGTLDLDPLSYLELFLFISQRPLEDVAIFVESHKLVIFLFQLISESLEVATLTISPVDLVVLIAVLTILSLHLL